MTQKEDGRWEMTSYELIPVSDEIKPDQETQKRIDELMDTVDTNYLADFGYTRMKFWLRTILNLTVWKRWEQSMKN